eukprot:TRINITY_DN29305_c0_g1_i1.p1 TRINITY_DN29305_c0_g1~~TRINITY_DN29305_c0_g1_i1.p1  ORF type:complete len:714 (+),score=96.31 TRINITY_DN29305_c0_g1_i1:60-2201(+)
MPGPVRGVTPLPLLPHRGPLNLQSTTILTSAPPPPTLPPGYREADPEELELQRLKTQLRRLYQRAAEWTHATQLQPIREATSEPQGRVPHGRDWARGKPQAQAQQQGHVGEESINSIGSGGLHTTASTSDVSTAPSARQAGGKGRIAAQIGAARALDDQVQVAAHPAAAAAATNNSTSGISERPVSASVSVSSRKGQRIRAIRDDSDTLLLDELLSSSSDLLPGAAASRPSIAQKPQQQNQQQRQRRVGTFAAPGNLPSLMRLADRPDDLAAVTARLAAKYRVLRVIGHGGSAVVCEAEVVVPDLHTGLKVGDRVAFKTWVERGRPSPEYLREAFVELAFLALLGLLDALHVCPGLCAFDVIFGPLPPAVTDSVAAELSGAVHPYLSAGLSRKQSHCDSAEEAPEASTHHSHHAGHKTRAAGRLSFSQSSSMGSAAAAAPQSDHGYPAVPVLSCAIELIEATKGKFVPSDEEDLFGSPMGDVMELEPFTDAEVFQLLYWQLCFKALLDYKPYDLMLSGQLRGDNLGRRTANYPLVFEWPNNRRRALAFPAPCRVLVLIDAGQGTQPDVDRLFELGLIGDPMVASCREDDGLGRYWEPDRLYAAVAAATDRGRRAAKWAEEQRCDSAEDAERLLPELFALFDGEEGSVATQEGEGERGENASEKGYGCLMDGPVAKTATVVYHCRLPADRDAVRSAHPFPRERLPLPKDPLDDS